MVQVKEAGVASMLPARSFARTWNVCEVSARPLKETGLEHAANAAASSLHSKTRLAVGVMSSLPVKVKLADVLLVGFAGMDPIVVSGGVESRMQSFLMIQFGPLPERLVLESAVMIALPP